MLWWVYLILLTLGGCTTQEVSVEPGPELEVNTVGLVLGVGSRSCWELRGQTLAAASWAASALNSDHPSRNIEIKVVDMCKDKTKEDRRDIRMAISSPTLIGLLIVGDVDWAAERAEGLSVLLASPRLSSPLQSAATNHLTGLLQAAVCLAEELGARRLGVVSSSGAAMRRLPRLAAPRRITVTATLPLIRPFTSTLSRFVHELSPDMTVILILEAEELRELVESSESHKIGEFPLIIATVGLEKSVIERWKSVSSKAYLIEPEPPKLTEFKEYFLNRLQEAGKTNDSEMKTYVENLHGCYWEEMEIKRKRECTSLTRLELSSKMEIAPEVVYVIKGVSFYSAALLIVDQNSRENCKKKIQKCVLTVVKDFTLIPGKNLQIGNTLDDTPSKYLILRIGETADSSVVGRYTEGKGLWMEERGNGSRGEEAVKFGGWLGLCLTLLILLYVWARINDGTLSGNQSLGVLLLGALCALYLGLALGSGCLFRLLLFPLSLALSYALLLTKLMRLRALVLLGLGGRISYLNQYLVLLLALSVQAVLCAHVLLSPDTENLSPNICPLSPADFLTLHVYPAVLSSVAFLYGLSVLRIRRNYSEGRWVTVACGASLPVMLAWASARFLAPFPYREFFSSVSLLLLATLLLTSIFLPKMTIISEKNVEMKRKPFSTDNPVFATFAGGTRFGGNDYLATEYVTKNPIYRGVDHGYH